MMPSRRERIKQLLKVSKVPLAAEDIMALLGEREDYQTIYEDLNHIAKSLYAESGGTERMVMIPPKCKNCGFIFKGLSRLRKPSKCPKCKSERVAPPLFRTMEE